MRFRCLTLSGLGLALLLAGLLAWLQYHSAIEQRDAARQDVSALATVEARLVTLRDQAEQSGKVAVSRELAANAMAQLPTDPELSTLLAVAAAGITRTTQVEDALRESLLNLTIRATLRGHTDTVTGAAFSPDGQLLLTNSVDGTARMWDLSTGRTLFTLSGRERMYSAGFTPDGQFIITTHEGNVTRLWHARTGQLARELKGSSQFWLGAGGFSADGGFMLAVSDWPTYTVQVWETSAGRLVAAIASSEYSINNASISPDGKWVIGVPFYPLPTNDRPPSDKALIWDVSTGQVIAEMGGHAQWINYARFSPDGQKAVTSDANGIVRIWYLDNVRKGITRAPGALRLSESKNVVSDLMFSQDGQRLLTYAEDGVRVFDVLNGQRIAYVRTPADTTRTVLSPDGTLIATTGRDGVVRVWDVTTSRVIRELRAQPGLLSVDPRTAWMLGLAFSPDSKQLVTYGTDRVARVWSVASLSSAIELGGIEDGLRSMAFTPDGKWLFAAGRDHVVQRDDTLTGSSAGLNFHDDKITSVTVSSDGRYLASTSTDGTAVIMELMTRQLSILRAHTAAVNRAAFSPDGQRIVTASEDGTARVWDARTGNLLAQLVGHTDLVYSAAFSPDGELVVTAGRDGSARVWDSHTGRAIAELRGSHDLVRDASFSPDGGSVLLLGWDSTPSLWDVSKWRMVSELRGHTQWVNSALFSPDGKLIATASNDQSVRLWDAVTGRGLVELRGHTDWVNSVEFSPNGQWLLTASKDRTAQIWEVKTGRSLITLRGPPDAVSNAVWSADGKRIATLSRDGTLRQYLCDVCGSFEDLFALARARVTRALTCDERQTYLHESLNCPTPTPLPTPTSRP